MSEQQKHKSELDSLILAYPCPIKWESMKGDERKRFCDQCSMNVINISDMSTTEANEYLRKTRDAENSCVKFYLRSDGTIKTDNCPSFLKPIKRKIVYLNKVISITMAVSLSWLTSFWKDGAAFILWQIRYSGGKSRNVDSRNELHSKGRSRKVYCKNP